MPGWTRLRAAESSTARLGTGRFRLVSTPIPLNTWEYRPLLSRLRSCGKTGRYSAAPGMILSTVRSTADPLTWRAITGNGAFPTKDPISQVTTRTAMTLTAAPPSESRMVAGRPVTRERTATPMPEAISMPTTAMPKTIRIAMNACQVGLLASAREIPGAM